MPLKQVPVGSLLPGRFKSILTEPQSAELDRAIDRARRFFTGRVIWTVNSTSRGGGVAELLWSLVAYSRGAGVDARWMVMEGTPDFFKTTKRIHNMLHGSEGDGLGLGPEDESVYLETAAVNAKELARLVRPDDIILLHDPQTGGLVAPMRETGAKVIWRCHVGVDVANDSVRSAWQFLLPHVRRADAFVFSRDSFIWDDLDRDRAEIIPPSIDAFSAKNQELSSATKAAILQVAGLQEGTSSGGAAAFVRHDGTPGRVDRQADLHGTPRLDAVDRVLVQISRWDRLKDHAGVLEAFERGIASTTDAHLLLAGPSAAAVADDPEGPEVLEEIRAQREACPPEVRERVHLASLPMQDAEENAAMVNALQRRADVVAQKSLAEGFGLTVAEAMWKARPAIASDVGGIRDQVIDGQTGVLVEPRDLGAFARAVRELFDNPERAGLLGDGARDHVRDSFLGPRHLTQYVDLFGGLIGAPTSG